MRVGLVLSAGAARGLAHIGVVEELRARGHEVAVVAGTSAGALVGGVLAAGKLEDFKGFMLGVTKADLLRHVDPAVGAPGLLRGARMIATLRSIIGDPRIEDCPIPFVAVAADLVDRREIWFTSGSLLMAIRASIAIPVIFTPLMVGGRLLVDGGVLDPLPVGAIEGYPVDVTVGVSLFGRLTDPIIEPVVLEAEAAAPAGPAALTPLRASADGRTALPGRFAISQAALLAVDSMEAEIIRARLAVRAPDVLIEVPADAAFGFEFDQAARLIELGRSLASPAFDAAGL